MRVCARVCVTIATDAPWIGAAVGAHVPPGMSAYISSAKPLRPLLLAAPSDVYVTLMRVLFVAKVGGSSCARKLHAAAPTNSPLAAPAASPSLSRLSRGRAA